MADLNTQPTATPKKKRNSLDQITGQTVTTRAQGDPPLKHLPKFKKAIDFLNRAGEKINQLTDKPSSSLTTQKMLGAPSLDFARINSLIERIYPKSGFEGALNLTPSEIFPDINSPLVVGSSSGKVLGNHPIFGSGGQYAPFGIIQARENALIGAAQQKAQAEGQAQANLENMFDLEETKIQYQRRFEEDVVPFINDFYTDGLKEVGSPLAFETEIKTPGTALNIKYRQLTQDINNYRRTIDFFVDLSETALTEFEKGTDTFIPPSILGTMREIRSGNFDANEFIFSPEGKGQRLRQQLVTYPSISKILNQSWVRNIEPVVRKTVTEWQNKAIPGTTLRQEIMRKLADGDMINKAVDIVIASDFNGKLPEGYTRQMFVDGMNMGVPNEINNLLTIEGTERRGRDSGRVDFIPSQSTNWRIVDDAGKEKVVPFTANRVWHVGSSGYQPKKLNIRAGTIYRFNDSSNELLGSYYRSKVFILHHGLHLSTEIIQFMCFLGY